MVKLSREAVQEILAVKEWSHGLVTKMAKKYGVTTHTIHNVLSGRTWVEGIAVRATRMNDTDPDQLELL